MPSVSERQAHFMAAVTHGWQPNGRHMSVSVAKEFHKADKKEGRWEHTMNIRASNKQSSDHQNGF